MSEVTQQIRERLDIAAVLKEYIQLFPAGKNFKARCPFHKEKTPSFIISPDKQIWHCFGCSAGGDIFGFVMRYENIEFAEALKILADKAGIDLRQAGGPDQRKYNLLYEINAKTRDYFRSHLAKSDFAKNYLKERGLTPATIEEFEVGYAPNISDGLIRHLAQAGLAVSDIERAGLAVKTERGTYWDRFRDRIMFPLHNHFGKVVGFTGRINPQVEKSGAELAKYINTPETPVFNKSKLLFGFHKAKNHIREAKAAVLVEGQMDFLMLWQDGVKNGVATSGTALTGDHLSALRRAAETLVLSFDSDEAGQLAAERSIDLAEAADFSVKVLPLAAGAGALKDPADIVKASPGKMAELIGAAEPAMRFYFNRYLKPAGDIAERKKQIRAVLGKIKYIASAVERAHWLQELSKLSGIAERHLYDELENVRVDIKAKESSAAPQGVSQRPLSRKELIAQRLVTLASLKPEYYETVRTHQDRLPSDYRAVLIALADGGAALAAELRPLSYLINLRASYEDNVSDPRKEITALADQLKLEHLKDRRRELAEKIKNAEATGDSKVLTGALKEFDSVSRELHNI